MRGRSPPDLLRIDVLLALLVQEFQRKSAVAQDNVVKFADVEFGTQFQLSFLAQLHDFHLAHLVGERLAGPGDVTINFGDRFLWRVRPKRS